MTGYVQVRDAMGRLVLTVQIGAVLGLALYAILAVF